MRTVLSFLLVAVLVGCGQTPEETTRDYVKAVMAQSLRVHRARLPFDRIVGNHLAGAPVDVAYLEALPADIQSALDEVERELGAIEIPDDPSCRLLHARVGDFLAQEGTFVADHLPQVVAVVEQDYPPSPRGHQAIARIYAAHQQGGLERIGQIDQLVGELAEKHGFTVDEVIPEGEGPSPLAVTPPSPTVAP